MKYLFFFTLLSLSLFAKDKWYIKHDKKVFEKLKNLEKNKNDFALEFNLNVGKKKELVDHTQSFLKSLNRETIEGLGYDFSSVKDILEPSISKLFSGKSVLNREMIILGKKLGKNKSKKLIYEVIFRLNLYLKYLGMLGSKDSERISDILFDTYYVANKVRSLDLDLSIPLLTLADLKSKVDLRSKIGVRSELIQPYFPLEKTTVRTENSTVILNDEHTFTPNIYLGLSKKISIKGEKITFHPLALIYAPSANVNIVKKSNESKLIITGANIITKGRKSIENPVFDTSKHDFLRQFVKLTKVEKIRRRYHCDGTVSDNSLGFLYRYDFSFNHSKVTDNPDLNDAESGGQIKVSAYKIYGISHLDSSGAHGIEGGFAKPSIACFGETLTKLKVLDGRFRLDYKLKDFSKNYEYFLNFYYQIPKEDRGMIKSLRLAPGKPRNGQHGGHGGHIVFLASDKQLYDQVSFLDFSRSGYGNGGSAQTVSKCSSAYYHNRSLYKSNAGLTGASGLVISAIAVEGR